MLKETAKIIKVDNDFIWLETDRKSSCSSCAAKSSCGTQVLSNVLGKRPNLIKLKSSKKVLVGDTVNLGIDENKLLLGSFYLYLVPLIFTIIFSSFANIVTTQLNLSMLLIDFSCIIFAAIGFVFGQFVTRIVTNNTDTSHAKILN